MPYSIMFLGRYEYDVTWLVDLLFPPWLLRLRWVDIVFPDWEAILRY